MVRRGRRSESVRGLEKRPAIAVFVVSADACAALADTFRTPARRGVGDNALGRALFGTREFLDHVDVRRERHGRRRATLLSDLDHA
jgi:hypothetical protein